MFFYQPTFSMLSLRKDKGSENVIFCESKSLFESKLLPLHEIFLSNLRRFGYKIVIQFKNTPLVVEQNDHATKIVNAYIVFNLDKWVKVPLNNFKIKNCLFGATNIIKNSNNVYNVYSKNMHIVAME